MNRELSPGTDSATPLPEAHTRRLWLRMAEIYGHRWTSAYGVDVSTGAGGTWAKGLAGLSAQQIAAGLGAAMASADPWPPTLPQFRAMCLGIPTLAAVACQLSKPGAEATPFVRLVWQNLDGWAFRHADQREADRLLRAAYEIACEHVMRGQPLPEPSLGIEADAPKPRRPASDEVAREAMARIASVIGLSQGEAGSSAGEVAA